MSAIIEIKNLSFAYDEESQQKTLSQIDLTIEQGQWVALIGHNGSGKSTLAKLLDGLLTPTEGTITVAGLPLNEENIWEIRDQIGMVFQNPDNQLVSSIVEDDVAFGPENLGIDPVEIRRRVDDALTAVNMGKYKKKSPHMLSGGQKQRIAIAGVVAMKPECIIFDEPTAMLDPKGREEIMEIIRQLHDEGITVVLITHFMDEAVQADRIIIMDRGHVLLDGTPEEVFAQEETIREASLDLPLAVELAQKLRKRGIKIPKEIITAEGLVEFICQYK